MLRQFLGLAVVVMLGLVLGLAACDHDTQTLEPQPKDLVTFDVKVMRKILEDFSGGDVYVLKAKPHGMFGEYRDVAATAQALDREVVGATPFTYAEVALRHGAIVVKGVLKGVAPSSMTGTVAQYVGSGDLPAAGTTDVALGIELATTLQVKLGDSVDLQIHADPTNGFDHPSEIHPVRVASVLRMGGLQLDYQLVVMNLADAQQLMGRGDVATGVEVRLTHDTAAHRIAKQLEAKLGATYQATDWCESNKQLLGCTWHD